MPQATLQYDFVSEEPFLAGELQSDGRHECLAGAVHDLGFALPLTAVHERH